VIVGLPDRLDGSFLRINAKLSNRQETRHSDAVESRVCICRLEPTAASGRFWASKYFVITVGLDGEKMGCDYLEMGKNRFHSIPYPRN